MNLAENTTKPLRILHVDDDEDDYVIMRDLLSDIGDLTFQLEWVATFDEAVQILTRNEHDLCLLDYFLGGSNGLQLFEEAKAQGCQIPFIMLTGSADRSVDLLAMQSGINYFINKNSLEALDLDRTIRYSLEHARLLKMLTELNQGLEERVIERTQLLREAKEQLEQEIEQREALENQLRQLRHERELQAFQEISKQPKMAVTAKMLGIHSLQEYEPATFKRLVERYSKLLEFSLEAIAYKIEYDISGQLRELADLMGSLKLSPRDVVEIHNAALKSKGEGILPEKADRYIGEGRLLILELMGYLVSYYRNFASGNS